MVERFFRLIKYVWEGGWNFIKGTPKQSTIVFIIIILIIYSGVITMILIAKFKPKHKSRYLLGGKNDRK